MEKSRSPRGVFSIALLGMTILGFALVGCNQEPGSSSTSGFISPVGAKSSEKDSIKAANKAVKDSIKAAKYAAKDSLKALSKGKKLSSQSIMVGISGPTTFLLQDSSLWSFRDDCAAPYFNIPGIDSSNFLFPDGLTLADKIAVTAIDEKCIFWNGGQLNSHNCNGTVIFPQNESGNIDSKKCWEMRPVYAGKAPVTFNITVASQKIELEKSKSKCDFSSTNSDGTPKTATITVTLIDANTGAVIQVDHPSVTYVKGDKKSNNCHSDLHYEGNGGRIGNAKEMLEDGDTMDGITKDDDDDSNDGDKGCNKKAKYVVSPITYNLAAGSYKIQVAGILSTSTGIVDQSFTGLRNVVIGPAPSCPIPPPQCPYFDPNAGGIAYPDVNDKVGVYANHPVTVTPGSTLTPGSCHASIEGPHPALPLGLTVDPSTCAISGTPTLPTIGLGGTVYYKVRAQSSCGPVASVIAINVAP